MDQPTDPPAEVRKFAPKQRPRGHDPTDAAGLALLAMLQQAASRSDEECDRAMAVARELSFELRAAEERVAALEAELDGARQRAARAEGWLDLIRNEIEERLIAPLAAPAR